MAQNGTHFAAPDKSGQTEPPGPRASVSAPSVLLLPLQRPPRCRCRRCGCGCADRPHRTPQKPQPGWTPAMLKLVLLDIQFVFRSTGPPVSRSFAGTPAVAVLAGHLLVALFARIQDSRYCWHHTRLGPQPCWYSVGTPVWSHIGPPVSRHPVLVSLSTQSVVTHHRLSSLSVSALVSPRSVSIISAGWPPVGSHTPPSPFW